jgi:hypothetical protein
MITLAFSLLSKHACKGVFQWAQGYTMRTSKARMHRTCHVSMTDTGLNPWLMRDCCVPGAWLIRGRYVPVSCTSCSQAALGARALYVPDRWSICCAFHPARDHVYVSGRVLHVAHTLHVACPVHISQHKCWHIYIHSYSLPLYTHTAVGRDGCHTTAYMLPPQHMLGPAAQPMFTISSSSSSSCRQTCQSQPPVGTQLGTHKAS